MLSAFHAIHHVVQAVSIFVDQRINRCHLAQLPGYNNLETDRLLVDCRVPAQSLDLLLWNSDDLQRRIQWNSFP